MSSFVFTMLSFLALYGLMAQEVSLKVEVSTDSILYGNYFEVRFTIENAGGDFQAPDFDGFEVLSGPNTSSSFSMINGKVSQEASYSYVLRPMREGTLYIDPAAFKTGDEVLETEPIGVQVYPNPAGIEENKTFDSDRFGRAWPVPEKRKKEPGFTHKKRKI